MAVDAGVDVLLSRGGVTADNVVPIVHGAMFTRGPKDLCHTAVFVGGSDVPAAEKVLARIVQTFFGPMRVSVMLDASGSSTTAAAAVQSAARHVSLKDADALVLGGTGPVGMRTAQLLALQGAHVRIASRSLQRAEATAASVRGLVDSATVSSCECTDEGLAAAVDGVSLIVSAGAAGVQFLSADEWQSIGTLKLAIDLNAVPPPGLEGIEPGDQATDRKGIVCYGAIGVGGLKMKIHKAAIDRLFQSNDQVLDTAAIFALAQTLD